MVENRAGANGMIAAEGVAHADGDGYTMLACNSSTITLNKTLFKEIRYDPEKDFAPLTTVVSAPLVLVVNPENPRTADIKTVADLVAAAKAASGALAYGSGGNGNLAHLVDWHHAAFDMTEADTASHIAGLGFDASIWEIWPCLGAGGTLVLALTIPARHAFCGRRGICRYYRWVGNCRFFDGLRYFGRL